MLSTGSPIRSVLPSSTSGSVALVTRDSLLVWNPATDRFRGFGLAGLQPFAFHEGPEGQPIAEVGRGTRRPSRLARGDSASGHLVEIQTPSVRGGRFHAIGRGPWILLYDPAGRPPATIQAYDVRNVGWVSVENPGVSGWEPLSRWDRP